jgi:holin-like protein
MSVTVLMNKFFLVVGLGIIFLLNFLSVYFVSFFHIHFPSPLIGLIVLAVLLQFKIIPIHWIEDSCNLLLKNMGLFFVPLLVGIVLYSQLIADNMIPIIFTIILSSIIIICTTGKSVEYLVIRKKRIK